MPTEEERERAAAREREKERKRKEVDAWRAEKEAKERELREREEARRATQGAKVDDEVCATFFYFLFWRPFSVRAWCFCPPAGWIGWDRARSGSLWATDPRKITGRCTI